MATIFSLIERLVAADEHRLEANPSESDALGSETTNTDPSLRLNITALDPRLKNIHPKIVHLCAS
jgi:hypothetical protein